MLPVAFWHHMSRADDDIFFSGGDLVVRWYWGVLLIWSRVGQGPTVLAVGAGGVCLDIFFLVHHFSFLSPSLWESAQYRLKYCLRGPLSPKQPTNKYIFSSCLLEWFSVYYTY